MKKTSKVTLLLTVVLLAIVAFSLAACNTTINPDDYRVSGQTDADGLNIAEVRSAVKTAIETDMQTAVNAPLYTVDCDFAVTRGAVAFSVKSQISVDTTYPENTQMYAIISRDTGENDYVYYTQGTLYATSLDGEAVAFAGIDLTTAVDNCLKYLSASNSDLSGILQDTLRNVTSPADGKYVFTTSIESLWTGLVKQAEDAFGGQAILNTLLGKLTITEADYAKKTQTMSLSLVGDKLSDITIEDSGYTLKLTSFKIKPSSTNLDDSINVDPNRFTKYGFNTIAASGTLNVMISDTEYADFTALLPTTASIKMPAIFAEIKFSALIIRNTLSDGTQTIDAEIKATIPAGFLTDMVSEAEVIVHYISSDNTLYLDLSAIGMDKISISFDAETFDQVMGDNIGANVTATDLLNNLLTSGSFKPDPASDDRWIINLQRGGVESLLSILGLNNVLNIDSANVAFDLSLTSALSMNNLTADIRFGIGSSIRATIPRVVSGFGIAEIDFPDVSEYKSVAAKEKSDEAEVVTLVTEGAIALPSVLYTGAIRSNDFVASALKQMLGYDFSIAKSSFTRTLNYKLLVNLPLTDTRQMSVSILAWGDDPTVAILVDYRKSDDVITVYQARINQFEAVFSSPISALPAGAMLPKFFERFNALFSEEDVTLLSFLLQDKGMIQLPSIVEIALGVIFDNKAELNNARVESIVLDVDSNMKAMLNMSKGIKVTISPSIFRVYFSPVEVDISGTYAGEFHVYGDNAAIDPLAVRITVGNGDYVFLGNEADSEIYRIIPASVIAGEQGSEGGGYLYFDLAGQTCRVPAGSITQTEIAIGADGKPEIYPVIGANTTGKSIVVEPSDSFLTTTLEDYVYNSCRRMSLRTKVGDASAISIILPVVKDSEFVNYSSTPIVWDTAYNAGVFAGIYSEGTYNLRCYIYDNTGAAPMEYYVPLKVENLADINAFNETSLGFYVNKDVLTFYSYAGKDPTKEVSAAGEVYYPRYIDLAAPNGDTAYVKNVGWNNYTDWVALSWDLTAILTAYQTPDFRPYESDHVVKVSVTATNIFGCSRRFDNIEVTIRADVIDDYDKIDFEPFVSQFGAGMQYVDHTIYVNPLVLSSIDSAALPTSAVISCRAAGGVLIPKTYIIDWVVTDNGTVPLHSADNTIINVNTGGANNAYLEFYFGDAIGKRQCVKCKVVVLTRQINSWDIALDSNVNVDLFDLSIPEGLSKLSITEDDAILTYNAGTLTIEKVGAAPEVLTTENYVTSPYKDSYIEMRDLCANAKFYVNGTDKHYSDIYSLISDMDGALYITAKIGNQTLTGDKAKKLIYNKDSYSGLRRNEDIQYRLDENDAIVSVYSTDTHTFDFDPYGDIDFTNRSSYPEGIELLYNDKIVKYNVSWNLDALIDYLKVTGAYNGVKYEDRIRITATVYCVDNIMNGNADNNTAITETFDFFVTFKARKIVPTGIYYNPVPQLNLGYDYTVYPDPDLQVIDLTPIRVDNGNIVIFDGRDADEYAKYIGVAFETGESTWLPVSSWDVSKVVAAFGKNVLNEIQPTADGEYIQVTAYCGTAYGGYQTVTFKGTVSDETPIEFSEFRQDPVLMDSKQPYKASVEDGTPVLSFDPYSIDMTKADSYPGAVILKVRTNSGYAYTSAYAITWDLSNLADVSYNTNQDSEIYATVADLGDYGIKFKAIARVQEDFIIQTSGETQVTVYMYPFSALFNENPTLANLFRLSANDKVYVDAAVEGGETWIYYLNRDFSFTFENGVTHALYLRFKLADLPTQSTVTTASTNAISGTIKHLTEVWAGNDWGGYQCIYYYNTASNRVEVEPKLTVNVTVDYRYIDTIDYDNLTTYINYTRTPVQSFEARYPNPLPDALNADFGYWIDSTTGEMNIYSYSHKLQQAIGTGNESALYGISYEWYDRDDNASSVDPYCIGFASTIGFDVNGETKTYRFETEKITLRGDIENLFKAESDGGIFDDATYADWAVGNCIDFEWDESFAVTDGSILDILDPVLKDSDIDLLTLIKTKFVNEIGNGTASDFGTFTYYLRNGGDQYEVKKISKPGLYTLTYTVRNDEKYYGSSSFDFRVNKKDITADTKQYANGTEMANAGTYRYTYSGEACNFGASFFAEYSDNRYDSVRVQAVYSAPEIRNVGSYKVSFVVVNTSDGSENELYCMKQIVNVTILPASLDKGTVVSLDGQSATITSVDIITVDGLGTGTDITRMIDHIIINYSNGATRRINSGVLDGTYDIYINENILLDTLADQVAGETLYFKMVFKEGVSNYAATYYFERQLG